jgi:hypothetical protein
MNAQDRPRCLRFLRFSSSLLVVLFAAWLNTRTVIAHVDALRAEMNALRAEFKQGLAELELRLTKQISELSHRVERLEEQGGRVVRP